jgi:hypothetical protein
MNKAKVINWRKKNPEELVKLEDRYGKTVYVCRRDLILAQQGSRRPLLHLYTKDGKEAFPPFIHVDNLRSKPLSAGHQALEKIFPVVDFIAMSASSNEDGCLVEEKMADRLLLLVVRGLAACEKEAQEREGVRLNGQS